jgi:hypothetical protein
MGLLYESLMMNEYETSVEQGIAGEAEPSGEKPDPVPIFTKNPT